MLSISTLLTLSLPLLSTLTSALPSPSPASDSSIDFRRHEKRSGSSFGGRGFKRNIKRNSGQPNVAQRDALPLADSSISTLDEAPSTLDKRGSYSGMATYYFTQTGNQGSCGSWLSDSAFTVAVSEAMMTNSWCGQTIWITHNGNTQYATVQDTCPGCAYGSLDLSPGLFMAFEAESVGTFSMTWGFTSEGGGGQQSSSSAVSVFITRLLIISRLSLEATGRVNA